MDALSLLQEVSEAYRNLGSLEAEALVSSESFDDGCRSYNEQRVRFAYAAPNQVRLEHPRRPSRLTISDGHDLHSFFDRLGPNNEGRYSKVPMPERKHLPGMFQAEYPYSQGQQAFLFDRIEERVASTEILQSEALLIDGKRVHCDLISVTHEPPEHRGFVLAASPTTFWVDQQTRLIMRQEGEVTIKTPHDDARTTKSSVTLTRFSIDQPISPEMFSFTPPKGVMDISPQGRMGGFNRGGGGGGFSSGEGQKGVSCRRSHNWDGDTFVEQSAWTFRGHEIIFRWRFSLSSDEKHVQIEERIIGPKEETERTVSVPVS